MKRILPVLTLLLALSVVTPAYAQFGVYGSLVLPQADLGDGFESLGGGAELGFGGGVEYAGSLPIVNGLGWAIGASVMFNPIDNDGLETRFAEPFTREGIAADFDVDTEPWLIAPVMAGLRYEGNIGHTTKLYGTGQVGFSFIKAPTVEFQAEIPEVFRSEEGVLTPDNVTTFAFTFGGGIVINKRLNVGFRYFNMGSHDIIYKDEFDNIVNFSRRLKISVIIFTVGIHLWGG